MVLGETWNSLEAAKIFVGILTPLAIFVLGIWVAREARRWDERQWTRRTLYERRLRFWDQMSPALNDMLCFFTLVGRYREITPPRAIKLKRELDPIFFANEHLFPAPVSDAYADFIDACYRTFTGKAKDAELRSSIAKQKSERNVWDPEWEPLFVQNERDVTEIGEVAEKYRALVQLFTTDDFE